MIFSNNTSTRQIICWTNFRDFRKFWPNSQMAKFSKLNPREISSEDWFAKINPREKNFFLLLFSFLFFHYYENIPHVCVFYDVTDFAVLYLLCLGICTISNLALPQLFFFKGFKNPIKKNNFHHWGLLGSLLWPFNPLAYFSVVRKAFGLSYWHLLTNNFL